MSDMKGDIGLHPSLDVGAQPLETLVQTISASRARRLRERVSLR